MPISTKGYILEKPRVGSANSPFTSSPDNVISDSVAYGSVFGTNESNPGRCEYLVLASVDGNLPDAEFGWTKNESGVQRFDYDGLNDGFRTLPGSTRKLVGVLGPDSNTARIRVTVPTASSGTSPYRVSVGAIGSGTTFAVITVVNDAAFTVPAATTVQLSLDTGNLNWLASDLTSNEGQSVYYQRQSFFTRQESKGKLGLADELLTLNPIPGTGQKPLLRFGFGLHLTPVERSEEANFSSNPVSGTVEWALATGLLKFNSSDMVGNAGEPVYYDGVLLASDLILPRQTLGTVTTPSNIAGLPSEGGDIVFRAKNGSTVVRQFPVTVRVSAFSEGKSNEVQVEPSGAIQFSASDIGKYGSRTVEAVFGDLPLERGLSMRFFRNPVNLDGSDPTLKDVVALVSVEDATLADPVIGVPSVFLPVLPVDDGAYPIVVSTESGTGTYVGTLPRLDTPSPPSGLGYTLDFDSRQLVYAKRSNNQLTAITARTAAMNLPDVLVNPSNALFEINQGVGFSPLTQGVDVILDSTSGVLTLIDKKGVVIAEGSSSTVSDPGTLVDLSADFVTAGVQSEDLLIVPSGPLAGVYTVLSASSTDIEVTPDFPDVGQPAYQVLRGKEILADKFFQEIVLVDPQTKVERLRALGAVGNAPRLTVDDPINTRVRLPSGTVVPLVAVATDSNFTVPGLLPSTTVQVSLETRNLNFSSSAPSGTATEVRKMVQGVDYKMNPELGFIQFTERMLSLDEVWVTYASSETGPYVLERASFLVRKEVVNHPVQTSTMSFNLAGRSVAGTPAPAVFRGGRPQTSSQVSVTTSSSTIIFLPDVLPTPGGARAVTDTLPHGPIVEPVERITIDYYVYGALGGENTITVLNPPIYLNQVVITDGENSFDILGDWSGTIPANHLLRIGADQVYYITSSTYDGTKTTITVSQPFRDDFLDPKLFVSSGEIRLSASGVNPAYFLLESASYTPVPRGMNKVKLVGDLSSDYQTGTVVYFDAVGVSDYYLVTGSKYDEAKDSTEVTLSQNSARQYNTPTYALRKSVRPVFESGVTSLRTKESPLILSPAETVRGSVTVFRQTAGNPGVVLGIDDYKIDDSGKIDLTVPLAPNEEVSVLYTHYRFVNPGTLRSSYTATIVPTADNGLLNQKLLASFTSYIPDSFYFRIETMSAYRSEVAESYKEEAKASAPSGGPRTSNSSSPKLHEQGSESVFFREGDLANEDIIARSTLNFYNDSISHLEGLLSNLDGRVVGDQDGLFKFDGTTGSTVSSFSDADNQIDDNVKLSNFPIDPTPPLFPLKYKGTYLRAYEASADSRFYPTFRRKFGYTVAGADTNAKTGDAILDFETKNLTGSSPTLSRRSPRAIVTRTSLSGDSQVFVDTTNQVDSPPFRPPFANGMKVVIQNPNGSFLVTQGSPLEVQSKTSTSLTFTTALLVSIPIGASVYLADSDTVYRKSYRIGFDTTLDQEKGYALYVKPYPPYDGSVGGVPPELEVQTPNSEELLETGVFSTNSITAPYRFPALDGSPLDDDGDQRLPLVNPSPEREVGSPGYLETEWRFVSNSGTFDTDTVDPFIGVGDISGGGLIITLASGVFPSPVPQPGDLVRTLSGLNGESSFRRVASVGVSSLTVDVAFTNDTGASFLVTTADNLTSGSLSTIAGPVVTDLLANFITSGVKRGHTMVRMAAGAGQYERRQVLAVNSAIQITLSAPFTNVTTPAAYRVHNSLNTFSDISDLENASNALLGILSSNSDSEVNTIDSFFAEILSDRLSPVTAAGNVSGSTLTGTGVDFIASGVQPGDLVYVTPTQANQGFYLVDDVTGPTTLTVTEPFPVSGAITFRAVSVFGASIETLSSLLDIRTQTLTFYSSSVPWSSLVSTPVPVLVPPGVIDSTYFARGYTPTDVSDRRSEVDARRDYVPDAVSQVESTLASSDRLYDKRYVWIDARINLEKGILVKKSRAVADRLKAQEETLKQLTKLLAVQ